MGDTETTIGFFFSWASLLGVPVIALAAFTRIARRAPHLHAPFIRGSAGALIVLAVLVALGFGFTYPLANVVFFFVGYAAYCFIAAACSLIPGAALRIVAQVVTAVPIIVGYLAGTIGVMGLGWAVGGVTAPPAHTEQVGEGLVCNIRMWGAAGAASGERAVLTERWTMLPFVERTVAAISVDETGPDPQAERATCPAVLAKYARER